MNYFWICFLPPKCLFVPAPIVITLEKMIYIYHFFLGLLHMHMWYRILCTPEYKMLIRMYTSKYCGIFTPHLDWRAPFRTCVWIGAHPFECLLLERYVIFHIFKSASFILYKGVYFYAIMKRHLLLCEWDSIKIFYISCLYIRWFLDSLCKSSKIFLGSRSFIIYFWICLLMH